MRTYLLGAESGARSGTSQMREPAVDKRARWPWVLGVTVAGAGAIAATLIAPWLWQTSTPAESLAASEPATREPTTMTLSLLRTGDMHAAEMTSNAANSAKAPSTPVRDISIEPRPAAVRLDALNTAAGASSESHPYGASAAQALPTDLPVLLKRLGLPDMPSIGPDQNGMAVRGVTEGSLLHRIGLRDKDVLMTVDGQLLAPETLSRWLPSIMNGQQRQAYVLRDGQTIAIELSLAKDPAAQSAVPPSELPER